MKKKLIVPNAPMDFNAAIFLTLLYLSRIDVFLVCDDVSSEEALRLGFNHASLLEEAINLVSADKPDAQVSILPSGGLTVPLVRKSLAFN
jgi:hypothetical protein